MGALGLDASRFQTTGCTVSRIYRMPGILKKVTIADIRHKTAVARTQKYNTQDDIRYPKPVR